MRLSVAEELGLQLLADKVRCMASLGAGLGIVWHMLNVVRGKFLVSRQRSQDSLRS